jgi:BASS family bile acid:Na+ symporter
MLGQELLPTVFNVSLATSIIATMLSLGLGLTIAQALAPLRRIWLMFALFVLNALPIPALAWRIAQLFPMSASTVVGLTIATVAAGSAAGLKAAQLSKRADMALAIALVVALQLVDIVAVPLWGARVVTGASIESSEIVKSLLTLVLIPFAIGLLIHARIVADPAAWQRRLVRIANSALGVALGWAFLRTRKPSLPYFATRAPALSSQRHAVWGSSQGGETPPHVFTTALISEMRCCSVGLFIISTQLGEDPAYLGPAICFTVFDLAIILLVAVMLQRLPSGFTGAA